MDTALAGRAAIVGIGQTEFSRGAGRSVNQLAAEAAIAAIADAGIDASAVDGTVTFSGDGTDDLQLIRNIGAAELRWTSRTRGGGGGSCAVIQHAAAAVAAGAADHVLVYRSLTQATDRTHRPGQTRAPGGGGPTQGYRGPYAPFGLQVPAHIYSLWFQRYMYRFGLTNEDFGRYSVVARRHAATNPAAYFYGRPITLEDHQNSRWIVEPILRLLDCCQTNDGAVALIVTTPERAADLPGEAVIVEATSQSHLRDGDELHDYYLGDRTEFAEATSLGRRLYEAAGLTPDDIDTAMIYENFSPLVFLQLEAFGFCGVGEARDYIVDGNIDLDGKLPVNTNGGLLGEAYIHGVNLVLEAVRQVRGTAANQVPDVEHAMVCSGRSALILGNG
jgi:acetyl-CoA acetyltransferase